MTKLRLYDSLQQNYILGNTMEIGSISQQTKFENIFLELHEYLVYYIESNPTIISNEAFP